MSKTIRRLAILPATLVISTLSAGPGGLSISEKAAAQGKTSQVVKVTTTIYDNAASGAQLLLRSDNPNAGQATYANTGGKPNQPSISSTVDSEQWLFSFSESSGRTIWLTPNQAVDYSQPAAPPAGYYVVQKIYSVCRDQSGNKVPYTNLTNGSNDCSLAVNFEYAGILYKLLMRPGALEDTTCPANGCPATGRASVSCNAVSSGKCANWTITPNANSPLVGVSNLYSYTGPRGGPWVYVGQYYNTFRINISNP